MLFPTFQANLDDNYTRYEYSCGARGQNRQSFVHEQTPERRDRLKGGEFYIIFAT